jgi:hypothetical protein
MVTNAATVTASTSFAIRPSVSPKCVAPKQGGTPNYAARSNTPIAVILKLLFFPAAS